MEARPGGLAHFVAAAAFAGSVKAAAMEARPGGLAHFRRIIEPVSHHRAAMEARPGGLAHL